VLEGTWRAQAARAWKRQVVVRISCPSEGDHDAAMGQSWNVPRTRRECDNGFRRRPEFQHGQSGDPTTLRDGQVGLAGHESPPPLASCARRSRPDFRARQSRHCRRLGHALISVQMPGTIQPLWVSEVGGVAAARDETRGSPRLRKSRRIGSSPARDRGWNHTHSGVASLAAAGLFGVPAMYWPLDHHGHRRLLPLLLVGTVASLAPLLVVVSSGMAGLLARGGMDAAMRILKIGAPIPAIGVMPWPAFGEAEFRAAIIGSVSAATYWMIFLAPKAAARWRSL
jgi:hypothetical protein